MTYLMTTLTAISIFVVLFVSLIDANTSQQQLNVDNQMKPMDRLQKRASFMPSRGKKETNDELLDSSLDKKSAGFLPMRGRKDYGLQAPVGPQQWYVDQQAYDYYNNAQEDKRAGFMPMRGRKSGQPSTETEIMAPVVDLYPSQLDAIRVHTPNGQLEQFMGQPDGQFAVYPVAQPYVSYQRVGNSQQNRPNWMEGQHSLMGGTGSSGMIGGTVGVGLDIEKKANAFFGARGKRSVSSPQLQQHYHKNNEHFFATRG